MLEEEYVKVLKLGMGKSSISLGPEVRDLDRDEARYSHPTALFQGPLEFFSLFEQDTVSMSVGGWDWMVLEGLRDRKAL